MSNIHGMFLDSDRISSTWIKLNAHLTERLAILRSQLEADIDEQRSTRLRGQIFEVKALLALNEDRPFIDES